jgi:CRP-like cAMP-binding protein
MPDAHEAILRKLNEHSFLSQEDIVGIRTLSVHPRTLDPDECIVNQGDAPQLCVVVLTGMLGRYHTLANGERQYLSFHIAGDMPDAQALFLETMDHSVCAIDKADIALVPHKEVMALFVLRPGIGFAIWRDTLIDAAMFREAITNNGTRAPRARMAHLFCEQYYRAQAAGIAKPGTCRLPLSQAQIGQTLGLSLVTVNRTLQDLRRTGCVDLREGILQLRSWKRLAQLGQFDPSYLHVKREPKL